MTQNVDSNNTAAGKKSPLTVILIAVLAVLVIIEGGILLRKMKRQAKEDTASVQQNMALTAEDEAVKKYFSYEDGFFGDKASGLLGMDYSSICSLFGHAENDDDLSGDSDGFCIYITFETEVCADFHFKDGQLYRVALYTPGEDFINAINKANELYGSCFRYRDEGQATYFTAGDDYDYWVWEKDGETHQQYIQRYCDNIGYYIDDMFFTPKCQELIGQSYVNICENFGYEITEEDFDEYGCAEFTYTVFDYDDKHEDAFVRFDFGEDQKLWRLTFYCSANNYEAVCEAADSVFDEPFIDENAYFFEISDTVDYNVYLMNDERMVQTYAVG